MDSIRQLRCFGQDTLVVWKFERLRRSLSSFEVGTVSIQCRFRVSLTLTSEEAQGRLVQRSRARLTVEDRAENKWIKPASE